MIKLIVGTKGSGKTKAMIDQINDAVKTSKGNVVVVEKGMKLTYDIAPAARLIDLDEYKIAGGEMLYGFVAGLMASNYDITDLYIDGILKVLDLSVSYTHLHAAGLGKAAAWIWLRWKWTPPSRI